MQHKEIKENKKIESSADLAFSENIETLKFDIPSSGIFGNIGNQSTNIFQAYEILKEHYENNSKKTNKVKLCVGYCSNIISTGLREILLELLENSNVRSVYTSCGGIEEDVIKIFHDTFLCPFDTDGNELRKNQLNRIGGVVLNSKGYEELELILLAYMNFLKEEKIFDLTPTEFLKNLYPFLKDYIKNKDISGKFMQNNKSLRSVLKLCHDYKVSYIPVGITDGSIGDILTFYKNSDLFTFDSVRDYKEGLNDEEVDILIIGDGNVKNRILHSNKKIRNVILFTTRAFYDGCDVKEVEFLCEKLIVIFGDATVNFNILCKFLKKEIQ